MFAPLRTNRGSHLEAHNAICGIAQRAFEGENDNHHHVENLSTMI
jgi:hypothetical protein